MCRIFDKLSKNESQHYKAWLYNALTSKTFHCADWESFTIDFLYISNFLRLSNVNKMSVIYIHCWCSRELLKLQQQIKVKNCHFAWIYYIAERYTTAGWRRWDAAIFRTTPIHSQICNKAELLIYITIEITCILFFLVSHAQSVLDKASRLINIEEGAFHGLIRLQRM